MKKIILLLTLFFSVSIYATDTNNIKNLEIDNKSNVNDKVDNIEIMISEAHCHVYGTTSLTIIAYDAKQQSAVDACENNEMIHGDPPLPKSFKCQKKGSLTYEIRHGSPVLSFEEVCGFSNSEP